MSFKGKCIYNPSGKAVEYSYWAANFYNGCSAKCEYCYNRHSRSAKVVGGDVPTLKKSLIDEFKAYRIFTKEAYRNLEELIYWKDSLLKQAEINREFLPSNCVTRDFNL